MKENITEKERFFSKVSHDLRGSFTSILGFSDILCDPKENLSEKEIQEFSKRIGNQSKESYELLVNFINWLKLENYDYGLTNEKLDLLDIMYELKSYHKKVLSTKKVTVEIKMSELDYIFMDYEIIYSILNNILLFLIKSCNNNSAITFKTIGNNDKSISIDIYASCRKDTQFLNNIDLRNLNNDLSFPIIFAIKFTEQCGGKFNFNFSSDGNTSINLVLPKK